MRKLFLVLAVAGGQEPAEEAREYHRLLEKHLAAERDSEAKLRLEEALRAMRSSAARALVGGDEDPRRPEIRIFDTRNLLTRPKDHACRDFWKWPGGGGPLMGAYDALEQPPEPFVGEEAIVELLKEKTGRSEWEGDQTIERTPTRQILVQAPAPLQRKVAAFLRWAEAESQAGLRGSIVLFALAQPPAGIADPEGALPEEMFERLSREEEGARRLGGVELTSEAEQVVSAFSGTRVPVVCFPGDTGTSVPDGLAVQFQGVPSPPGYRVEVRLAFTRVLGVEEVGGLRLPRLVEARMTEQRRVPAGRWVRLGVLGPLAPEANLPAHLLVVGRFAPTKS